MVLTHKSISIENHKKDLEKIVFKNIGIKKETYEKLEAISRAVNKTPIETTESIINEMYSHLKKAGDI